jgi:hypothetical protein
MKCVITLHWMCARKQKTYVSSFVHDDASTYGVLIRKDSQKKEDFLDDKIHYSLHGKKRYLKFF